MISAFVEAFKNIRANFLRTVLSILGIVIGVAALVVILSLIDGMEEFALKQINATTTLEYITLQEEKMERVDGVWIKKDTVKSLSLEGYLAMVESLDIKGVGLLFCNENGKIYANADTTGGMARYINKTEGIDFKVLEGSVPNNAMMAETPALAIVNEKFVKALFKNNTNKEVVGKPFSFNKRKYTIAAVSEAGSAEPATFYASYTNIPTSELASKNMSFMIKADHVNEVPIIKEKVEAKLNEIFDGKHDMKVMTNEFRVKQVNQGFVLFRLIMGFIVGISVVVGGIGVMNVMIISVTERIKEIGIRKAVGAQRKAILTQFLFESITISIVGSFIGLITGMLITLLAVPIIKSVTEAPFQAAFTPNTFLIITIIAVATGVIFGTYPAMKASKLDPVDAIRHE